MNNLSFFHPEFLWALFILIIPIIIHFFRQKRVIKLNFSSTRFLKDIAVKASRINRLKKILLLITRILILILLILIFAQPFNKKNPFRIISGSNTALYCWIDPTISMSYKQKGNTLWQNACNYISYIDSIIPSTSQIYCYDGRKGDFIGIHHLGSPDKINENITPLRHGSTDLDDMAQKFLNVKNDDSRTPVLILFSDFSLKDKSKYEHFFQNSQISFPILCVNMINDNPWNYSLSNPYILYENKPILKCDVKSKGRTLTKGEVVVEFESMRTGHKSFSLKKNDSLNISIDISQNSGKRGGKLQFINNDPFLLDNINYFLPHSTKRKRILILSDGGESFPVAAAFHSISLTKWFPPIIKKPVDVSFNDLDSSDIIVLSSIKESTEILSLLLGKSGLSKKLLFFAPYIDDQENTFNEIVFRHLNLKNRVTKINTQKPLFPILPDTISSLWQGFPRFADRDVSFYNYYSQIPGKPLLLLNNNTPLVTHKTDDNKHSWIIFASPIDITTANNLCETGFYVPLLDRVIMYGTKWIQHYSQDWIAGVPKNNPYSGSRSSARVYNIDNKSIAIWDRQVQVAIEDPGLYKIQPNNKPPYWIAVNIDPSEGNLTYEKPILPESNKTNIKIIHHNSLIYFLTQYNTLEYDLLWIFLILCLILEVLLWKNNYRQTPLKK